MSVFRKLDCLSLVVCSNTTLLKLQTVLFLFFSKFCASKSGVRLIHGCGLYMDVYGNQRLGSVFKIHVKGKIHNRASLSSSFIYRSFFTESSTY